MLAFSVEIPWILISKSDCGARELWNIFSRQIPAFGEKTFLIDGLAVVNGERDHRLNLAGFI